ncbi:MAG: HAMP domain-containing sensor histidine kinase [Bacteroidota bacterium]
MSKHTTNINNEDRNLILWLGSAGFLISVISLVINYQLNFGDYLILVTYGGIILYGALAFAVYKGLSITISQYLLVYITLIFTNLLWYFEYGSEGPVLYFFIIIFSLIIFIWHNKKLIIGSLILFVNLVALFLIDFYYPDFVQGYQTEQVKTIDIYSSLLMFGIIIYALMAAVKKSYAREFEKAKQADKLKSSFLENISHEIRTPLNAIVGFSSLLEDNELSKEQRQEYNELISDCNQTLLRVIDDILQVSLLETEQLPLAMDDCQLNELLEGLDYTYGNLLIKEGKSEIKFEISESTLNAVVITDRNRLQQVLMNLLDNAVKFTKSGSINFGYKITDENILFHVSDTGIGIKRKYQKLIFDRFYKIDDNRDELYRGTGIGLFLTEKILESFEGAIWVESTFGSGATFYFTIPKNGYHEFINLSST